MRQRNAGIRRYLNECSVQNPPKTLLTLGGMGSHLRGGVTSSQRGLYIIFLA